MVGHRLAPARRRQRRYVPARQDHEDGQFVPLTSGRQRGGHPVQGYDLRHGHDPGDTRLDADGVDGVPADTPEPHAPARRQRDRHRRLDRHRRRQHRQRSLRRRVVVAGRADLVHDGQCASPSALSLDRDPPARRAGSGRRQRPQLLQQHRGPQQRDLLPRVPVQRRASGGVVRALDAGLQLQLFRRHARRREYLVGDSDPQRGGHPLVQYGPEVRPADVPAGLRGADRAGAGGRQSGAPGHLHAFHREFQRRAVDRAVRSPTRGGRGLDRSIGPGKSRRRGGHGLGVAYLVGIDRQRRRCRVQRLPLDDQRLNALSRESDRPARKHQLHRLRTCSRHLLLCGRGA